MWRYLSLGGFRLALHFSGDNQFETVFLSSNLSRILFVNFHFSKIGNSILIIFSSILIFFFFSFFRFVMASIYAVQSSHAPSFWLCQAFIYITYYYIK